MGLGAGLVIAAFLLNHGYAFGTDSNWESLIFKYFTARHIYSIDAMLCSPADGLRLYKRVADSTGQTRFPVLLRVIHNFSMETTDLNRRAGITVDVSCEENQKLLLGLADDSRLFTNNFHWLIWGPEGVQIDSYDILPLSTFSDVSVRSHNRVIRLYKHRSGMPTISRDVGLWDVKKKELSVIPGDVRIDYQKSVVTAAILISDDIYNRSLLQQQLQDDQFRPGKDITNRFIFGNTLHLAYLYNFSLNVTETVNWGDRFSNGTWNGLLGLLQSQKADITITTLIPLSQRMEAGYPSVPIHPHWMAVIFKQPRALGTYKAMILELSLGTWAFVGVLMVSGAVAFAMTQAHGQRDDSTHDGSFAMGCVQMAGIIANQGLSLIPRGNPARIVCLSLLLVSLIIVNYYNAAAMTALLSPSPPVIKSVEQLISSETPLNALDGPNLRLSSARAKLLKGVVADRMEKDLRFYSLAEGIATVSNGSAFVGAYYDLFRAITERLQSDFVCDLTVFNVGFHRKFSTYTKKCPHFRELYTRGMLRTWEHGLMLKEREKWIAGQPVCTRETRFIHVRMEAVSVAFGVFLIVGVALSALIFVVEVFLGQRKRRCLRRRVIRIRDRLIQE